MVQLPHHQPQNLAPQEALLLVRHLGPQEVSHWVQHLHLSQWDSVLAQNQVAVFSLVRQQQLQQQHNNLGGLHSILLQQLEFPMVHLPHLLVRQLVVGLGWVEQVSFFLGK